MRKLHKIYKRPKRPWDLAQIKEGKDLKKEYGLRRKKEIWKTEEILRNFRQRARDLIASKNEEAEKVLVEKLLRLGLLKPENKSLDDVLALTKQDVLNRRLQTIVFRKGMAGSPMQGRQMIVHGHVAISGRKIRFPSYLVSVEEEGKIGMYKGR